MSTHEVGYRDLISIDTLQCKGCLLMLNLESSNYYGILFVPGDGEDVLWEPNLLLHPDSQLD